MNRMQLRRKPTYETMRVVVASAWLYEPTTQQAHHRPGSHLMKLLRLGALLIMEIFCMMVRFVNSGKDAKLNLPQGCLNAPPHHKNHLKRNDRMYIQLLRTK